MIFIQSSNQSILIARTPAVLARPSQTKSTSLRQTLQDISSVEGSLLPNASPTVLRGNGKEKVKILLKINLPPIGTRNYISKYPPL